MKLSVIVPVYNVESYIERCMDSICNQSYHNLEIILIDDGSTDRSGEICDRYQAMDKRIQVIHKENGGIVSARKAGIQCASGEYATDVDADDWIEPDAYEFMVDKLKKYSPDILALGYKKEYAGFIEEYQEGIGDGFYQKEEFWRRFNQCVDANSYLFQPINMSLWSKAIKTELWRKHQCKCADELRKNVDDAVIFPCLLDIEKIYVESKGFYHYCVRNDSILWGSKQEDYELFLKLAESLIMSYHNSKNKDMMNKRYLLYKLFYHIMLDLPEKLFDRERCFLFPKLQSTTNVIVYGKGVFASRLMKRMNMLHFCNVIDNIDRMDADRILQIEQKKYDFVIVAIIASALADSAVNLLAEMGVGREKIILIEKENLTIDLLPKEIEQMWSSFVE